MKNLALKFGFAAKLALGTLALASLAPSSAFAQAPGAAPSLQELLKPRYKLTRVGVAPAGVSITDPGPVFVLKKGGLLSAPPINLGTCAAQFKDGALHPPGSWCAAGNGPTAQFLPVGTKVFLTKFEVNEKKSSILFQMIECDSCDGAAGPTFKTAVSFQFAPNFLATAEPGQVTDVIDQVFVPDAPGRAVGAVPAPPQQAPSQPAPSQPAPSQPAQIQIGDTTAQVEAVLGVPETKIPLGAKLIYVYKNLKVTFNGGKVTDVQ